ncbi:MULTISPECIES: sigma 54-interacting transcriptional regulator [Halomonadaceae]|uniref:PAS domain S-box protein n=1 Tax=Vreelandella halophila TaxID=86177 RepID=A0A9X4YDP5_9GAMM|nr:MULTISPECIES: sigma 54-interacting transcriptional regulator [Halomonas]MYL26060.1 PAS domain S-box protein [Halomonas utahensis]MYL73378.1 PAS domain S-box protein [Halomonas sp. 22501_18_FS]
MNAVITPQTSLDWIEALPEPGLLVDPVRDTVEAANSHLARMLGRSVAELVSLRVTTLFGGQIPQLVSLTDEAMTHGQAWSRDLSLVARDERVIELEMSLSVMTEAGEPRVLMLLRDLTLLRERRERHEINSYHRGGLLHWKRVETLFREIERENQLILEAVGEGIYGVDAEGRTTFINSAAERMLGWHRDELLGRVMHTAIHHSHSDGTPHQRECCPIYQAFCDGAVHRVSDDFFWRRDGSGFPVEYTSTPIVDNGQLVGAVVVFRDITDRRRTEDSLKEALEEVENLKHRLEMENAYLQEEISAEHNAHEIVGRSEAVAAMIQRIDLVAPTGANVLVTGESGTGKELIARAIHNVSERSERPMIRVNCAAIPAELFESEFFGHAKGAFTGAVNDRGGRFELADGGTLFLDEVGEIPLSLQGKLLRVLQEQTFERIGETHTRSVDVRVIAATNRDLKTEVEAGRFREDLYFRLNVFPIESVPLRERPEDIPPLAQLFLRNACRRFHRAPLELSHANVEALQRYSWPGNVRELENVIERQVIVTRGRKLNFDLPADREAAGPEPVAVGPEAVGTAQQRPLTEAEKREQERENMISALRQCRGKVFGQGGAAELLELKPTTLASRLKRHGIDPRQYRNVRDAGA